MKSIPFFKGLSWLIVLNMLVKPVWLFFIDRQVQILVGYEEYGKYFAVLNLSYVLFFLSDVGISNMLNQRMANHIPVNIVQLLRIKLLLLLFYFIVFCFIGWLTHISYWSILFYVFIIQSVTSVLIFFRNIVTANQFFRVDAFLSVIDKTLMILLCGNILYASFLGRMSLLLFLKIQIGCAVITAIIALLFILKKRLIVAARKENIGNIAKQVIPFALIVLFMSLHYRLDGFLLERLHSHGAMEAGIYASAYRLLDAGNMVGYLASAFLVAFVARNIEDKATLEDAAFNARHLLMFFSLGVASFVIMFAPWVQELLYHSDHNYNSLILQLCVAAYPAYCLVHIYGSILTGAARFRQFITLLVISVILNTVLNIALIPSKGALGCCIAALASQYFCGIATLVSSKNTLGISYNRRSIFIYFLFFLLMSLFFYFGKNTFIDVWIILGTAVLFSLLVLFTQLTAVRNLFVSLR